jgi:hypothetical protein
MDKVLRNKIHDIIDKSVRLIYPSRLSISEEYQLKTSLKKVGILSLSLDDFLDDLNDNKLNGKVVIYLYYYFDVYLVISQELAEKILFLGYLPFENIGQK